MSAADELTAKILSVIQQHAPGSLITCDYLNNTQAFLECTCSAKWNRIGNDPWPAYHQHLSEQIADALREPRQATVYIAPVGTDPEDGPAWVAIGTTSTEDIRRMLTESV